MQDPKHARLMLEMAESDLRAIRYMLDPRHFADSIFGFHCQQAVEKLLKAWLSRAGTAFPRTHDLRVLLRLVADSDAEGIAPFWDLEDLTDYGVQFRYESPLDLEPLDRVALVGRIDVLHREVNRLIQAGETP